MYNISLDLTYLPNLVIKRIAYSPIFFPQTLSEIILKTVMACET